MEKLRHPWGGWNRLTYFETFITTWSNLIFLELVEAYVYSLYLHNLPTTHKCVGWRWVSLAGMDAEDTLQVFSQSESSLFGSLCRKVTNLIRITLYCCPLKVKMSNIWLSRICLLWKIFTETHEAPPPLAKPHFFGLLNQSFLSARSKFSSGLIKAFFRLIQSFAFHKE